MKILILGATGMLGSCIYRYFLKEKDFKINGILRDQNQKNLLKENNSSKLETFNDYKNFNNLEKFISNRKPDYVINCLGVIKQKINISKPEDTIFINSYLPHLLNRISIKNNFRLIHFSTDCVFDGNLGSYKESDVPLPKDFYGISKLLGELNTKNSLTLRTSIIGHELSSSLSLIDWFLSSKGQVNGFTKAIYSGFPALEIARIIHKFIIPDNSISGIYNISSTPISKYELLKIISEKYKHQIDIIPDEKIVIDRSLDSTLFNSKTNYKCPSWNKLVQEMYEFHLKNGYLK